MKAKAKVFIVNSSLDYERMFFKEKWGVVKKIEGADLIQFTGGEDVSPCLYGQKKHPKTRNNLERDKREAIIFGLAIKNNIPMAGICRGGQFLNVMCGGELWQDVDGHAKGGTHEVIDLITGDSFRATSTHHQMMTKGPNGLVVGAADESRWRSSVLPSGNVIKYCIKKLNDYDTEIFFYCKISAKSLGYGLLAFNHLDYFFYLWKLSTYTLLKMDRLYHFLFSFIPTKTRREYAHIICC